MGVFSVPRSRFFLRWDWKRFQSLTKFSWTGQDRQVIPSSFLQSWPRTCVGRQGLCLSNQSWESSRRVSKITGNGVAMPIIYLSFQKAFDKLPHRRLLRKLGNHRTQGKVRAWIKTEIRWRQQGRSLSRQKG